LGKQNLKVTVDTNVLIRAAVGDDAKQASSASKLLTEAQLIAIALPCLCEFVWVLLSVYRLPRSAIATAIRALIAAANVEVNRPAVAAGLTVLEAGGDFADGIIAYEGEWLGADTFVSFDKKAVALLRAQGQSTQLL
jgi:predicted nucleic-acid-binding protein